jgi:hypothetical protein
METEDSLTKDEAYDPIQDKENEDVGIELIVNDEILLELIDLVVVDSSVRNISAFSFALLTKAGIGFSRIKDISDKFGPQRADNSRQNAMKFHKSEFDIKSGGIILILTIKYRLSS